MKNTMEIKQRKLIEPGDVWQLGDHRVACGSASDSLLVKKLMGGGAAIRQILTDPPYGVAYVENKEHFKETIGAPISNTTVIQNDELQTDEEFAEFTSKWIKAVTEYLDKYNTIYIFNSDTMFCALRAGMKKAGIYYSQLIIWVKNQVVVGRKGFV